VGPPLRRALMTKEQRAEDEWSAMLRTAREVSEKAYAPYSHLRVAAVLRGKEGRDYPGCNVENSSFGLTICAEQAAVSRALVEGDAEWSRLLIYTPDSGPLSPCGACRQVLAEFCRELPILSVGRGGLRREMNLRELLPQPFAWPSADPEGPQRGPEGPAGNDVTQSEEEVGGDTR